MESFELAGRIYLYTSSNCDCLHRVASVLVVAEQEYGCISRPLLSRHDTTEPDVIVPELIEANASARRRFDAAVGALWDSKNKLVARGVDLRLAQYLLPNARTIRFQ